MRFNIVTRGISVHRRDHQEKGTHMVNVAERASSTETVGAPEAGWSTRAIRGGWAGELATAGGRVWAAWAGHRTRENEFVAEGDREWRMLPGATLDAWRAANRETSFSIELAQLNGTDGSGIGGVRTLAHSAYTFEGPALAASPNQAEPAVVWIERRGERAGSALHVSVADVTVVVAESRGAMLGPRAAVDPAGRLWVVWQQWPDDVADGSVPRVVVACREPSGAWSPPEALSPEGTSSWAPAVATDETGAVWCAWDAWDGARYRVVLARRAESAGWSAPVEVSGNERRWLDLAPDVAAAGGRAWVVWNRSAPWGQVNHRFNHVRSLHAAEVTVGADGALAVRPAPGAYLGEAGRLPVPSLPFLHSSEYEFVNPQAPRVRLGPNGPAVFYRWFRSAEFKDFGWEVHAVTLEGDAWSAPQRVSAAAGFADTPYGVIPAGDTAPGAGGATTWLLAYHVGDYPRDPDQHPSKPVSGHRLAIERVRVLGRADTGPAPVGVGEPPAERVPATGNRRASAPRERRRLQTDGATYELLWGDLHRHSTISKCMSANDGDPLDHWRWVQDVGRLDFYSLTEHLCYMSDLEWHRVTDLAQQLASGGVLALYGFEYSNYPGHCNFFFVDDAIASDLRVACQSANEGTLSDVWLKLDAWGLEGKVLAVRHNQSSGGGGMGTGWHDAEDLESTYAPRYERVVEGIQTRGEYKEWLRSLWRRGFRVGVVGASDHSRAAPFVQGLTGVWVPPEERTRDGVMRALHDRRSFATNGVRLGVYLSASGASGDRLGMGESGRIAGPVRLRVQVQGTRAIDTVEVYRDDQLVRIETPGVPEATLEVVDESPDAAMAASGGEVAYWARATQLAEGNGSRPHKGIAYSSPVFVARA
jgi:hypothetical protein